MPADQNKKREKIIITLAGIALVYALVDYSLRAVGVDESPVAEDAQVEATLSLINETLSPALTSSRETTATGVLAAASQPWPEDVFLDILSFVDHQEGAAHLVLEPDALIYSGYMTMGEKRLAVINGIEYQIGDMVEGFLLKEIHPLEIVVVKNNRPARIPFRKMD